jgi:cephalosporin hydroxylase
MEHIEQRTQNLDEVRAKILLLHEEHGETIDAFHKLYYAQPFTWGMVAFDGLPMLKTPNDLWTYQELIRQLQPTLIIETGTAFGGSALYFASLLDRNNLGAVISIDTEPSETLPNHSRVWFLRGSSLDPTIVAYVKKRAEGQRVLVILDSDHSRDHVLAEMETYGPLVTPGSFMVVEDTNICGRPVERDWFGGPGPGEAVDAFLPAHPEFVRDPLAERHLLTMHPGGWLRRIS